MNQEVLFECLHYTKTPHSIYSSLRQFSDYTKYIISLWVCTVMRWMKKGEWWERWQEEEKRKVCVEKDGWRDGRKRVRQVKGMLSS